MVRWDVGSADGALTLNTIIEEQRRTGVARLPRAPTDDSSICAISLVINPIYGVPMIRSGVVDELYVPNLLANATDPVRFTRKWQSTSRLALTTGLSPSRRRSTTEPVDPIGRDQLPLTLQL